MKFRFSRKAIGILIGIAIVVAMFVAIRIAYYFSPTVVRERDGIVLARAIDQYKVDTGHYPQSLDELHPQYVADLKSPKDHWGWLYVSTDRDFTLGYVAYVDKFGYLVCVIRSTDRNWGCLPEANDPFDLGPTPGPTQD